MYGSSNWQSLPAIKHVPGEAKTQFTKLSSAFRNEESVDDLATLRDECCGTTI